jgi:hypothetical protein
MIRKCTLEIARNFVAALSRSQPVSPAVVPSIRGHTPWNSDPLLYRLEFFVSNVSCIVTLLYHIMNIPTRLPAKIQRPFYKTPTLMISTIEIRKRLGGLHGSLKWLLSRVSCKIPSQATPKQPCPQWRDVPITVASCGRTRSLGEFMQKESNILLSAVVTCEEVQSILLDVL